IPTPTASRGRATCSRRGRPGTRWSGCAGPALVLPDDADHDALDHDVALVHPQRGHRRVRRLEADPTAGFTIELFDCGARPLHQGYHRLAVVGLVALVHDDEVAVLDVLVDHRLAADLEDVAAAATRDELVGHRDGVPAGDRLDRRPGGDEPEQRQLRRAGLTLGGCDLDRATFVVRPVDVALALQVGEMLVHRGEGAEVEPPGDFLEAWSVALLRDVPGDEVEDLALTTGERHAGSRRETEA